MPPKPVAIVLGARVYPDGSASLALQRRSLHACHLFHEGTVDRIVACGGLGGDIPSQAEVIREICLSRNVPESAIRLDDQSQTTRENLGFAKPIVESMGRDRVIVVTDRYHAMRALLTARRFGMTATASWPRNTGVRVSRRMRGYLREIPATLWYLSTVWPGSGKP